MNANFFFSWPPTWQNLGLVWFLLVTVGILVVLMYDYYLYCRGRTLITDYCRQHPWLAFLILCVVCSGTIGLAVHFMAPVPITAFK